MSSPNHQSFSEKEIREWLFDDTTSKEIRRLLIKEKQLQNNAGTSAGGARKRRTYVDRDREAGHARLYQDYFSKNSIHGRDTFRRRFCMSRELFLCIVDALESHDDYFKWRVDACGKKGFSPLQKCTVSIRQLAYGGPADLWDDYLCVAETTAIESLFNFCRCVIEVFGEYYLRKPTAQDCERLLQVHEQRHGFPGMLGSLDCMHWEWRNCPVAWKCQFTRGDHDVPTIMLEAVASADLWIWHAYFGVAGSNNDINVLNQSPLFTKTLQGRAPFVNFTINVKQYNQGYDLTDGIYPEWAAFVKSFSCPQDQKRKYFKELQESVRKDIERAFGVLQACWAMIKGPSRFWYKDNLKYIMLTCIILHNMIIKNEGNAVVDWFDDPNYAIPPIQVSHGSTGAFSDYVRRGVQLRDKYKHLELQNDLVGHVWAQSGNN